MLSCLMLFLSSMVDTSDTSQHAVICTVPIIAENTGLQRVPDFLSSCVIKLLSTSKEIVSFSNITLNQIFITCLCHNSFNQQKFNASMCVGPVMLAFTYVCCPLCSRPVFWCDF